MTSPWKVPSSDSSVAHLRGRPAPDDRQEPSRLRDPARMLILVGAAVAVATSPLPWLVRIGNPPPQTVSGWSGVADGFFVAVIAVALVALAWHRELAGSSSVLLRALPLLLGVVAATFGVGALRTMENRIEIWAREGASGAYQPALWAFLAGTAALAVGAVWFGVRQLRDPDRPPLTVSMSGHTARWLALGAVGAVAGGGLVAVLVLSADLNPVARSLPLLIGVMVGALAGANLGTRLARTIDTPPLDPDRETLDRVVPSVHPRRHDRPSDGGAG